MKNLHCIAVTLLVVGGLNWGLIGLFNYNVVNAVLGFLPGLVQVVYILVGGSAVYIAATCMTGCKACKKK